MNEKTLVLLKPDTVSKGLIGDVVSRFEKVGLKIVGMKMLKADDNIASNHYQITEEWAIPLFNKTKEGFEKSGKEFSYSDPMEYGNMIQSWNRSYLKEGPVVALAIEGPHAVQIVRKIVGHTEPRQALPGTIRGDFIYDSYTLANNDQRAIRNLIHASGDVDEAKRELNLWFKESDLC